MAKWGKQKNKIVFFSLGLLLAAELVLRIKFGFCDAVLIREDHEYEYIAFPNQNRFRFGRHIQYNEYSMRSDKVDSTAEVILGFGDSVINGGSLTDQDSLATQLLTNYFSGLKKKKVQVLNISAGSWGPDNCAAYLKKNGDFNAKVAFLLVSSHDAFDNMDFKKTVGVNPNYPDKQYTLALVELVDRYLLPRILSKEETPSNLGINKYGNGFNPGFATLSSYFAQKNIPFFICLHPEKIETEKGAYNRQGQMILSFCNKNNIPIFTLLGILQPSDYRDNNHLNEAGQKKLFQLLSIKLKSYLL